MSERKLMSRKTTSPRLELDRILVVKLADIGDAVLATPALGALRSSYPHARIDVLTSDSSVAVVRLCPAVDQIWSLNKQAFDQISGLANPAAAARLMKLAVKLRVRRYDAIVLLHHLTTKFGAEKFRWMCAAVGAPVRAGLDNGRGRFLTHRAQDFGFGAKSVNEYNLDVVSVLGAQANDQQASIAIPSGAREAARHMLKRHGIVDGYVVIHPSVGTFSVARNWFHERFSDVANAITRQFHLPVVLVGATDAAPTAREIASRTSAESLVGDTSIPELAALLDEARLVIGADSGVIQLAAALDTPVIAIFGPSNSQEWRPLGSVVVDEGTALPSGLNKYVVRANVPCSPCFYTGFSLGRRHGCSHRVCLDLVTTSRVAQIATHILSQNHAPKSTTL